MNNMLVIFHNKDKAEKLKAMGYAYMVDNSSNVPQYAFLFSEDVAKKLISNFDNQDYYFSNRLNFTRM